VFGQRAHGDAAVAWSPHTTSCSAITISHLTLVFILCELNAEDFPFTFFSSCSPSPLPCPPSATTVDLTMPLATATTKCCYHHKVCPSSSLIAIPREATKASRRQLPSPTVRTFPAPALYAPSLASYSPLRAPPCSPTSPSSPTSAPLHISPIIHANVIPLPTWNIQRL
jgi:hypothetical protein